MGGVSGERNSVYSFHEKETPILHEAELPSNWEACLRPLIARWHAIDIASHGSLELHRRGSTPPSPDTTDIIRPATTSSAFHGKHVSPDPIDLQPMPLLHALVAHGHDKRDVLLELRQLFADLCFACWHNVFRMLVGTCVQLQDNVLMDNLVEPCVHYK